VVAHFGFVGVPYFVVTHDVKMLAFKSTHVGLLLGDTVTIRHLILDLFLECVTKTALAAPTGTLYFVFGFG